MGIKLKKSEILQHIRAHCIKKLLLTIALMRAMIVHLQKSTSSNVQFILFFFVYLISSPVKAKRNSSSLLVSFHLQLTSAPKALTANRRYHSTNFTHSGSLTLRFSWNSDAFCCLFSSFPIRQGFSGRYKHLILLNSVFTDLSNISCTPTDAILIYCEI